VDFILLTVRAICPSHHLLINFIIIIIILRGIFGPTKENQTWRIKNNEELDKLIKHQNTVNHIKAQRLSWFGHIQRMPEARSTKKIFKWNPLTTRPRGRHKYRWEDIIQVLGQMKIKNWLTCVQDRANWKDGHHHTGPWSNEDQKLVNLCSG